MKEKQLEYLNFKGSVRYQLEDQKWFGEILNITDLVYYEAESIKGLEDVFKEAVDDYLDTCKELNREIPWKK